MIAPLTFPRKAWFHVKHPALVPYRPRGEFLAKNSSAPGLVPSLLAEVLNHGGHGGHGGKQPRIPTIVSRVRTPNRYRAPAQATLPRLDVRCSSVVHLFLLVHTPHRVWFRLCRFRFHVEHPARGSTWNHSLSDAEAREDLAQQVIGSELARDLRQVNLRKPQFLREKLELIGLRPGRLEVARRPL